jgi:hypothetical protein
VFAFFFIFVVAETSSFFNNNRWALLLRLPWRRMVLAVANWWWRKLQADQLKSSATIKCKNCFFYSVLLAKSAFTQHNQRVMLPTFLGVWSLD